MSSQILLLLFILGIAAYFYSDLAMSRRRYFERKKRSYAAFLRWWVSRSLIKFTVVGVVILVVALAFYFSEYTLVLPNAWRRLNFSRTAQWGALIVCVLIAVDFYRARQSYLSSGRKRGVAGIRFFRWWFRKSIWKLFIVVGVGALAVGGIWAIDHYNLLRAKSESSGYMAGAKRYLKEKKYREAALELRNAIKQNRDDSEANILLARTYWQLGALAEARNAYREAIRIEPKLYSAHLELGRLLLVMGETDKALTTMRQAQALEPLAVEPALLLALIHSAGGQPKQAVAQCRALIDAEFPTTELRVELVTLLLRLSAFREALQAADAGIKKNPNELTLFYRRAQALEMLGQGKEAEATLRAIVDNTPSPDPYLALGDLLMRRKEYLGALKEYEEALKRAPNNEHAMNNVASLNAEFGFDMDRSAALAARLYARNQEDPDLADTLGWTLFRQGKIDDALPLLRQAASRLTGNPTARYHLGAALLKNGETAAGRKELAAALKLSGEFTGADRARALLRKDSEVHEKR